MRYLYALLIGALAWPPGIVAAQQAAEPWVSRSAVQPGHWYLGISLGVPAYWRESVAEQRNLKSDNYKYEEAVTLMAGRQLTTHWAVQAGLNGFVEPVSTTTYQGTYMPTVFTTSSLKYGAAVASLPLLLRYNPRLPLGLDVGVEGWLGLTPTWQRLQVDATQYDNGQLTYDEHVHTHDFDVFATSGVSLTGGLGQGFEILLNMGIARRIRVAGDALAAPGWAPVGSLDFRYQLGGRPHRLRYQAAD